MDDTDKKIEITPPEIKGLVHNNIDETIKKKIISHRLEVEDNIYNNTWKSCCMELDRRAVQYFTQIFIIGGCMGFSIFQLSRFHSCEAQQTYIGLLTLLIGILLPNPKFKENN